MYCHFQQICKDSIHVFFSEMFKHMQRGHCIKCPYRAEIISKKISLNVADVGKMLFFGEFLCHLKNVRVNVNAYNLAHKWYPFNQQKREKTTAKPRIEEALTTPSLNTPFTHGPHSNYHP